MKRKSCAPSVCERASRNVPTVDLPEEVSQLTALCVAIAIETDATRKARMFVLQRKLLRIILPKIQLYVDQIDAP